MRFMHSISNNRWKNAIDFQLRRYNFGNTLHSVGGTACYFNGVFRFHFVCDREHTPHHTNFACVIVFWFDLISSSSSSSIFGVFLSNVVELCVLAVNFRRFDRINFRNCLTCLPVCMFIGCGVSVFMSPSWTGKKRTKWLTRLTTSKKKTLGTKSWSIVISGLLNLKIA